MSRFQISRDRINQKSAIWTQEMLFEREAEREKEKQSRRSGIDRCNESCPAAWAAAFQTIGVTFARSSNRRDFLRASVTRWPYGISFCSDGSAGVRSRHELIVRNERRGRRGRRRRERGGGAGGWRESIVRTGERERKTLERWKVEGRRWTNERGRRRTKKEKEVEKRKEAGGGREHNCTVYPWGLAELFSGFTNPVDRAEFEGRCSSFVRTATSAIPQMT